MEKILERLTAIIAALTVVMLALSVSHEFGYFAFIGGGFLQTFVSASDYLTNAILWLPVAVITVLGWWNWPSLLKNPPTPKKREWKTWIVPGILVGLPLVSFFLLHEGIPVLYLLLVEYLWLLFFDKFVPPGKPEILFSFELRKLLKISGVVCAAMFTLGYINADSDLSRTADTFVYVMHTKSAGDLKRIPLRNFEKGILVREPINNRVEVVLWEDVKSIEKPIAPRSSQSLVCQWFRVLCML